MKLPFDLHKKLSFWPFPRGRANRAVDAGDARRNRLDWAGAAGFYARAVKIEPSRRPIWVQLGHALKETGALEEALDAYRQASALPIDGDAGDAPLHLGVLAKQMGYMAEAKAAFKLCVGESPDHHYGRRELLDTVLHPLAASQAGQARALAMGVAEKTRLAQTSVNHSDTPRLVYDASDLVSYFRHSRLPTGIQRVQMDVICSAIRDNPLTQVCCFTDDRGDLVRIPAECFTQISSLAISSGNLLADEWLDAMDVLSAISAHGDPVEFSPGSFLVNLGTSWWLQNYFLNLRAAQSQNDIRYVPFVHDFIPVMTPQHCVRELTQDFLSWTMGVFDHAYGFLTNSHSTKADLLKVASVLGYKVNPENVAVIPLDADFRRASLNRLPDLDLSRWSLRPGYYVLFVSTIESRKNHRLAFEAWLGLIERHGTDQVPELVCVGNRGWLNDKVYAMLEQYPSLAAKVHMLSSLSDDELDLLYRNCCFTLYPSSYEGWGLPVTESLCYGKVPLLSRSSSLPEAGGDFGYYLDNLSKPALMRAIETLWFDPDARMALEHRIIQNYRPRSWSVISNQIRDALTRIIAERSGNPQAFALPDITFDAPYRMERNRLTRLVKPTDRGEPLRHGNGWWPLEDWGCWTKAQGAQLAFTLPAEENGPKDVVVSCKFRCPPGLSMQVTMAAGQHSVSAFLNAGKDHWVSFVAIPDCNKLHMTIKGSNVLDMGAQPRSHDMRQISVGLMTLVLTRGTAIPTIEQLARRIAAKSVGHYAFLRNIRPMLDESISTFNELEDYLLALETGAASRDNVIDILFDKLLPH